jgi:hypothetical protein
MPVWQKRCRIRQFNFQEMTMKTLYALALASFLGLSTSVAHADDAAAKPRGTKPITTAAAPVKISQQDKMRLCAKQATGKKGAERKTFMKGCLSKKA